MPDPAAADLAAICDFAEDHGVSLRAVLAVVIKHGSEGLEALATLAGAERCVTPHGAVPRGQPVVASGEPSPQPADEAAAPPPPARGRGRG